MRAIDASPAHFAGLGVRSAEDVAAALVLDAEGARAFAAGAEVNSDDRNHLQMRSPGLARTVRTALQPARVFAAHDPLLRPTPELDRVQLVRRLLAMGSAERARRVAEASEDLAERSAGSGLVAIAVDLPLSGRRQLQRALELDPYARDARAALALLHRRELVDGDASALALVSPLGDAAVAVIEGWRAGDRDDWTAVRALESRLAGLDSRDVLFPDAMRLRVRWRLADGDVQRVSEAGALVEELTHFTRSAGDMVLHAQVALAGGEGAGAMVDLFEAGQRLKPSKADRSIARRALDVLDRVPAPDADRERLASRLRAVLR
jgi:hypothetical protein